MPGSVPARLASIWAMICEFNEDEHYILCGISYIDIMSDVDINCMQSNTYLNNPCKNMGGVGGGSDRGRFL